MALAKIENQGIFMGICPLQMQVVLCETFLFKTETTLELASTI